MQLSEQAFQTPFLLLYSNLDSAVVAGVVGSNLREAGSPEPSVTYEGTCTGAAIWSH